MKLHERLKAIRSSRIAPSERHLITVIACYLGEHDDGPAYPSVTTMAKETGYAESQVHNLLRSMLASGLIAREEGGKRALLTFIRWDVLSTHVAAPSGRGGVRAKTPKTAPHTPKTAPIDDAALLDDGSKDCTHEGAKTGGWGAETGATPAKTAPDQFMIRPEISPEEQTSDAREHDAQPDEQPAEPPMPPDDLLTGSPTDPDFLAALDHVREVAGPMLARLAKGPTGAHNIGASYMTGSKPMTDADPIDNGGDKISHPVSAGPLSPLPRFCSACSGIDMHKMSCTPHKGGHVGLHEPWPKPHADEVTDATPLDPGAPLRADDARRPATGSRVVGVAGVVGDCGGDGVRAGSVDRLAGEVTAGAAPATGPLFAPPAPTISGVAPDSGQAVASKPKRGKGKQAPKLDLEAWGRCCQAWDTIAGKPRAWRPEAGDGKAIAEAMARDGAAKIVARLEQATRDPWCCSTARDSNRPLSVSALTRSATAVTSRLDAAAEQAQLDASAFGEKRSSEKPGDVGRVDSRPGGTNAPQASQAVSWPDVLRDLGSDPQHHPDDGPHREAWQRVRQAVLVSIRKPGDPWRVWCDADDRARQNVERLLVGGLVK